MSKEREILFIAKEILANKIGLIEASRKLVKLHYEASLENEESFKIFWVIDSETDHLPIGRQRENYSPERLKDIDKEIKAIEEFYSKDIKIVCNNLIKKYN